MPSPSILQTLQMEQVHNYAFPMLCFINALVYLLCKCVEQQGPCFLCPGDSADTICMTCMLMLLHTGRMFALAVEMLQVSNKVCAWIGNTRTKLLTSIYVSSRHAGVQPFFATIFWRGSPVSFCNLDILRSNTM